MPVLGACSNVQRCSKAASNEPIEVYPGLGEVCPECGRRLTPLPAAAESPAPVAVEPEPAAVFYAGSGATANPARGSDATPSYPPPVAERRPVTTITGRTSAADAPGGVAAGPIPPVQPVAPEPVRPEQALPWAPDSAPPQSPPSMFSGPAAVPDSSEPALQETEPPLPSSQAAAPAERWYIPPPVAGASAAQEPLRPAGRKLAVPRIAIYAALVGVLALIVGVLVARLLASAPPPGVATAFRVCGSDATSQHFAGVLAGSFLHKLGAGGVTRRGDALLGTVPGRSGITRIDVGRLARTGGAADTLARNCQVAIVARPPGSPAAGGRIVASIIGLDAAVVVVNRASPISKLSSQALARAMSGLASDWSEFGAPKGRINLYVPAEPSDYVSALRRFAMPGEGIAPGAHRVAVATEVAALVARDKNALGLASFGSYLPNKIVTVTGRDGAPAIANPATIVERSYPLTLSVSLLRAAQEPEPLVFEFTNFVRSEEGQSIAGRAGLITGFSS